MFRIRTNFATAEQEIKMKELIDKISSYNLFNYLLPGCLFAVFVEQFTSFSIAQPDIIIAFFLYYFIGLVVSRIGSLLLAPIAKRTKFVKYAEYADFVNASTTDDKLDTLSEANNTYRTLCTLFLTLAATKMYESLSIKAKLSQEMTTYSLCFALFLLFAFAYRKQVDFITKRIEARKQ